MNNIVVVLSSCIDGNVVNCEVASVEVTGDVVEYSWFDVVDVAVMVCKNVCSDCSKVNGGLDIVVIGVVENKFGAKVAVEVPKWLSTAVHLNTIN